MKIYAKTHSNRIPFIFQLGIFHVPKEYLLRDH